MTFFLIICLLHVYIDLNNFTVQEFQSQWTAFTGQNYTHGHETCQCYISDLK